MRRLLREERGSYSVFIALLLPVFKMSSTVS